MIYPGNDSKSGFDTSEKLKNTILQDFSQWANRFVLVFANKSDTDFSNIQDDLESEVDKIDELTSYDVILFGHGAKNKDLVDDLIQTQSLSGLYLINPYPSSSLISSIKSLSPNVDMGLYYSPKAWVEIKSENDNKEMYLLNAINNHLKKAGKSEDDFIAKVESENLEESIRKGLEFFQNKIDVVG